jgi:hypothetical protein
MMIPLEMQTAVFHKFGLLFATESLLSCFIHGQISVNTIKYNTFILVNTATCFGLFCRPSSGTKGRNM